MWDCDIVFFSQGPADLVMFHDPEESEQHTPLERGWYIWLDHFELKGPFPRKPTRKQILAAIRERDEWVRNLPPY
jgi:hypothetical protein